MQGILTGNCIENQQGFLRRRRQFPLNDPADFFKFFHQIGFGMQASCRIDDQNVHFSCFGRGNRIEDHRRRISAFRMADDFSTGAFGPKSQLLTRRRPKSIRCRHQDAFSLFAIIMRQFADRGSLAGAVDPDDENHVRRRVDSYFDRTLACHHAGDFRLQHRQYLRRVLQVFLLRSLAGRFDQPTGNGCTCIR